jgi:hypothetical protein
MDALLKFLVLVLVLTAPNFARPLSATPSTTPDQQFAAYCSACHSMNPPPKSAPPVRGIVMNYARVGDTRDSFISAVKRFVRQPSHEQAKLPMAVESFGLMPALPLPEESIAQIAGWMWDSIKGPRAEAFGAEDRARAIGEELALRLMKGVRAELEAAMQRGSLVNALSSCSEKAPAVAAGLTRQQKEGMTVGRISQKLRNPANAPDAFDLGVLDEYRRNADKQAKLSATGNGDYRYYKPLYVEAVCMSCHGPQAALSPDLSLELKRRYPHDKAVDYAVGDLRGLVKVVIPAAACALP